MDRNNTIIQSFWHGDALSNIERICINSFIKHGYTYHLYTYKNIDNLPQGVVLKDANLILSFKEFIPCNLNKEKTSKSWRYGNFSDLFRFRLLYLLGGWWHDTDSCCIKKLDLDFYDYIFAKHNILNKDNIITAICSGVMKVPAKNELFKTCFDIAYSAFKSNNGQVKWASIGSQIINTQIKEKNYQYKILEPVAFCPIKYWETKQKFLEPLSIDPNTYCIHFYTSTWSIEEANKYYDKKSLIGYLYDIYY